MRSETPVWLKVRYTPPSGTSRERAERLAAGASAAPYIAGTLLAIRRVPQITGVLRGLDRLLFA